MSESSQDKLDHGPEGPPLSVRRYTYQGKDEFSQVLNLERERLYRSMHHPSFHFIAKTISYAVMVQLYTPQQKRQEM